MRVTAILLILSLVAFNIWITTRWGWLALSISLATMTATSFIMDVIVAARRIDDGKGTE
jgi:hypothetical protein